MNTDPKGYYSILGISSTVATEEIKQAFRQKANELHPDKNRDRDTTKEFQFLNEAYAVLIDPNSRAKYDSSIYDEPKKSVPEPIKCSCCSKVTAQPRYVIYFEVKSFIFVTTRNTVQGIFCSECADKKVLKPTLITWALGWWGFPFGILFSLHAIVINLLGGQKPKEINRSILQYQAWYFAQQGKLNIADSIANDALEFSDSKHIDEIKIFRDSLKQLNSDQEFKKLKNKWVFVSRSFLLQLIIILSVLVAITGSIIYSSYQEKQISKAKEDARISYELLHPIQPLPENGQLIIAPKEEKIMAPFSIKTSGVENHFVKLEDIKTNKTIMAMFIRSGNTVETTVPLGTYKLKYAAGSNWYGEKELFGSDTVCSVANETFTFEVQGNQIVGNTVELILQSKGNLHTTDISISAF